MDDQDESRREPVRPPFRAVHSGRGLGLRREAARRRGRWMWLARLDQPWLPLRDHEPPRD